LFRPAVTYEKGDGGVEELILEKLDWPITSSQENVVEGPDLIHLLQVDGSDKPPYGDPFLVATILHEVRGYLANNLSVNLSLTF
jgi:hypothetical protein